MSSAAFNSTSSRFKTFCHTNDDLPTSSARSDRIPDPLNTVMDPANDWLEPRLKCCCGRPGCAYLEHNNAALGGIEKDLEKAARLGQALLTRHEAYISESQLEHARLTSHVADLEADQNSLQTANEKIVAENRELLSQLESLNSSYKNSDNQVKSLEALLRDCETEVRRLHGLARRAEELEMRVHELDKQRVVLTRQIEDEGQESRSTLMRWRDSERKVKELEVEVQKIEWEARLDREKHEEVVARLERERVLERELGGAEGRLKGAAALQGLGVSGGAASNVVSHFVRDILQDNASLQAGIVELRDLLQSSNEEVQNLRQQVLQHQPMESSSLEEQLSQSAPLDEHVDWNRASPNQVSQREVHVHHHYHAKLKPTRTPTVRRSSRKRVGMLAATPESSVPSTPVSRPQRHVSSSIVPISLHQPQPRMDRWSMQSAATMSSISSLPSSPRSYFDKTSSVFDRIELGEDSSRPTSPESAAGFVSPALDARGQKPIRGEARLDTFEEVLEDDSEITESPMAESASKEDEQQYIPKHEPNDEEPTPAHDLTPKPSQILFTAPAQPIDILLPDPRPPDPTAPVKISEGPPTPPRTSLEIPSIRPSLALHRSTSHDSLVSISGMDIHIAKRSTTSPFALLRGNSAHFARSPAFQVAAQPLSSVTEFTAISSQQRAMTMDAADRGAIGGRSPSTSLEALSGIAAPPAPPASGLGRLVGGWVRGKWGIAPMQSSTDLKAQAQAQVQRPPLEWGRGPGINQKGAIPGFRVLLRAPSEVHPKLVDQEGLREGLGE